MKGKTDTTEKPFKREKSTDNKIIVLLTVRIDEQIFRMVLLVNKRGYMQMTIYSNIFSEFKGFLQYVNEKPKQSLISKTGVQAAPEKSV